MTTLQQLQFYDSEKRLQTLLTGMNLTILKVDWRKNKELGLEELFGQYVLFSNETQKPVEFIMLNGKKVKSEEVAKKILEARKNEFWNKDLNNRFNKACKEVGYESPAKASKAENNGDNEMLQESTQFVAEETSEAAEDYSFPQMQTKTEKDLQKSLVGFDVKVFKITSNNASNFGVKDQRGYCLFDSLNGELVKELNAINKKSALEAITDFVKENTSEEVEPEQEIHEVEVKEADEKAKTVKLETHHSSIPMSKIEVPFAYPREKDSEIKKLASLILSFNFFNEQVIVSRNKDQFSYTLEENDVVFWGAKEANLNSIPALIAENEDQLNSFKAYKKAFTKSDDAELEQCERQNASLKEALRESWELKQELSVDLNKSQIETQSLKAQLSDANGLITNIVNTFEAEYEKGDYFDTETPYVHQRTHAYYLVRRQRRAGEKPEVTRIETKEVLMLPSPFAQAKKVESQYQEWKTQLEASEAPKTDSDELKKKIAALEAQIEALKAKINDDDNDPTPPNGGGKKKWKVDQLSIHQKLTALQWLQADEYDIQAEESIDVGSWDVARIATGYESGIQYNEGFTITDWYNDKRGINPQKPIQSPQELIGTNKEKYLWFRAYRPVIAMQAAQLEGLELIEMNKKYVNKLITGLHHFIALDIESKEKVGVHVCSTDAWSADEYWTNTIPHYVYLRVQADMLTSGINRVLVCCLINGTHLKHHWVNRNEDYCDVIPKWSQEAMECVETGNVPLDKADPNVVFKARRNSIENTSNEIIEVNDSTLYDMLVDAKNAIEVAKSQEGSVKIMIQDFLKENGNAKGFRLLDGTTVQYEKTNGHGKTLRSRKVKAKKANGVENKKGD